MLALRKFLTPPVFADDETKTRVASSFFVIAKVSGLAVLLSLPILLPFMRLSLAIIYASFTLVFPALMTLTRLGYPRSAATLYGLLTWILVTGSGFATNGNRASGFVGGTLVMVMVMNLLLGWRGGFGFSILTILSSVALGVLELNGDLPTSPLTTPFRSTVGHGVMLLTAVAVAYASTKSLANALHRAEAEIAQRRKTEEALTISERRYRLLVENFPESAVIVYDHDMRYVLTDGPELETVGLKKEQLEGQTLYEALPADFVAMVEPDMRAALAGKQFTAELAKDGLHFYYHYVPLRDASGNVILAMILAQNITDRKRLEHVLQRYTHQLEQMVEERTAELRTAKEQIEVIIENTRDAIALVHSNGDVHMANPAFRAMFDERTSQAIESILMCVPDQGAVETLADGLIGAIVDRQHQAVATRIMSPNGEGMDIDLALVPISDEKRTSSSVVVSAHDITHFKDLERLKERFVADAVHDLSTPISALAIRVHLLKSDPAQLEKHVQSLEGQVQHLSSLLEDLRTLSRLDRGVITLERERANLNQIVQRIYDTYEPVAMARQQTLRLNLDPNLPSASFDPRQMGRVIVNLISNAVNYTKPDKCITVRTTHDDHELVIEVTDEGMGINEQDKAHIFDRFYRAEQARTERAGGTGLGLAIVKEIIDLHGGAVSVESGLGQGSTFRVRLPV